MKKRKLKRRFKGLARDIEFLQVAVAAASLRTRNVADSELNELKRRLFTLEHPPTAPIAQQPENYAMSYSFVITERTKAAAVDAVWERLNDVATTQPSHRLDLQALQTASRALIMTIADDPSQSVRVVMSGWVNARGQLSDERAVGVQTSIQVSQVDHPTL